jgi:hypothetical protein
MQGDGPSQPRFTPQAGMGMFGLQQVQLFWERSLDTKVQLTSLQDLSVDTSRALPGIFCAN